MRAWQSMEEEQIFREVGMRQAIYTPVFEDPDWATFTAGMKAKILQFSSAPGMGPDIHAGLAIGQDVYDVRQSIADLGETDKSWEQLWTVGKTQNREGA